MALALSTTGPLRVQSRLGSKEAAMGEPQWTSCSSVCIEVEYFGGDYWWLCWFVTLFGKVGHNPSRNESNRIKTPTNHSPTKTVNDGCANEHTSCKLQGDASQANDKEHAGPADGRKTTPRIWLKTLLQVLKSCRPVFCYDDITWVAYYNTKHIFHKIICYLFILDYVFCSPLQDDWTSTVLLCCSKANQSDHLKSNSADQSSPSKRC